MLRAAFGENPTAGQWNIRCPSGDFPSCFRHELRRRYPIVDVPPTVMDSANALADNRTLPDACTCARGCSEGPLTLFAVATTPTAQGLARRQAMRRTWFPSPTMASMGCFIIGRNGVGAVEGESDVAIVDEDETDQIYRKNTRYSGYKRAGRRMPTFKQFRFFHDALARWPKTRFFAKIDDDSLLNVGAMDRVLRSVLRQGLSSASLGREVAGDDAHVVMGTIHWTSIIPKHREAGVRMDRCAFGWNHVASLHNVRWDSCHARGGTLPFPYAAGAGYVFSRSLLRDVVTDKSIRRWVADARSDEDVQWQKNEDASWGYMIASVSNRTTYVSMVRWNHNFKCRPGKPGGLYRSATPTSIVVHDVKRPDCVPYVWSLMRGRPFRSDECRRAMYRS